jgi:hypothetical protein
VATAFAFSKIGMGNGFSCARIPAYGSRSRASTFTPGSAVCSTNSRASGARARSGPCGSVGQPPDFDDALTVIAPLPDGVTFAARAGKDLDVVVLFVTRSADLARRFAPLVGAIAPPGRLWVAWPKRSAKRDTDVDFGLVQSTGLAAGLVDNKSASITDAYQGLQFVWRRADRPR